MSENRSYGHITECQICGKNDLVTILELGHQPPVHSHLTAAKLNDPETTYPLNFCRCTSCGLLQLDYIGDPKIIFSLEYPYQTGMTNMLIRNFRALADSVTANYNLGSSDLVVDIGSNDGTLLAGFKEKGTKVLGIEPTDIAKIANEANIETIQAYFDEGIAQEARKKYGPAKIITCTNAYAHIYNLYEITAGIKTMLADDGVFISESQYLMDIIENLEVDTIYHEHLRFYALKPLITLFDKAGFTLVDAERITAAGGSIRVYAMKGNHPVSDRVRELIAKEEAAGLYDEKTLQNFAQRAIAARHKLLALLLDCKKQGARIVGIGAPARSNTLLGFAKIDKTILEYACERGGSPKIGLYTPGTHLPIKDEKQLFEDQPEYALMLSWHIGEELMKKLRELGYKGKFIMPLPEPRIVDTI